MDYYIEMKNIGKMLEDRGLVASSHSGNLSIRVDESMYIKRTGAMLGALTEKDIIKVDLNNLEDPGYKYASVESKGHRAIYLNTDSMAVIHAHTTFAIVESLIEKEIVPVDIEGKLYLDKVPVIEVKDAVGSVELAERLGEVMQEYPAAIVKGHGTFAHGSNLIEAFKWITIVESISKIKYYFEHAHK